MEGPEQLDSYLGGPQELPAGFSVTGFAYARSQEIAALMQAIDDPQRTALVFQQLPKHMRRRVMSQNSKRMPRKLREAHLRQLQKSGLPTRSKAPSRKYRRRARNLLDEYNRRQRRNVWLETHIWHAKRFHMAEKWGYKIALSPNDKKFRACYRAVAHHCLMFDMSYYACVELSGPVDCLLDVLGQHTSPQCGLTCGAKALLSAPRYGRVCLFERGRYPLGAIGVATVVWRPASEGPVRTLWLWCHPTWHKQVVTELSSSFGLQPTVQDDSRPPCYENTNRGVQLVDLKDRLVFLRLVGPLSGAVLSAALSVPVRSPSKVPPHTVLAMNVGDPREQLPVKRTKAVPTDEDAEPVLAVPSSASEGQIWSFEARQAATAAKLSNTNLARVRSQTLVVEEHREVVRNVPAMLLQCPGSQTPAVKRLGFGAGYDLVLPVGWGMPAWLSLVLHGAHAGGLRESASMAYETGNTGLLSPDSVAGQKEAADCEQQQLDSHFRLPPNKRPNFIKLGIVSPFRCVWEVLVRDWMGTEVCVLRERQCLVALSKGVAPKVPEGFPPACLVPVSLSLEQRGKPVRCALICLPTQQDLETRDGPGPVERLHPDAGHAQRKELVEQHHKALRSLRRRRVCGRAEEGDSSAVVEQHRTALRALWLPSPTTLRHSCSRTVVGVVTEGDFSLSEARGIAHGFVMLPALVRPAGSVLRRVLIRNPTSSQYRFAQLQVVTT